MISRIRGIILEKQTHVVLVDVNGVGYELLVPVTTVFELPEVGQVATFHTHFIVREDAQQLYGFYDLKDRELFRVLIRVNGVGPKMALALLSGMTTSDFVQCVQNNDIASLTRLPGVGKKTAERLLVEVRDKLADWLPESHADAHATAAGATSANASIREAETALQGLGYKIHEAAKAVAGAQKQLESEGKTIVSEALIRLALKSMP